MVDFDSQSYYVRREVMVEPGEVQQVDLLKNLRTSSEKKRRAETNEELQSVEEEYKEEDKRLGSNVETLYFQALYGDPNEPVKLARPLEFPSLAEKHELTSGMVFRDVSTRSGKINTGTFALRFSPRGGTDFAVVHVASGTRVFTLTVNPTTGEVKLVDGDVDLVWGALIKQQEMNAPAPS